MKRLLGLAVSAVVLAGCQTVDFDDEVVVMQEYKGAELLSQHETIATLKDVQFYRCPGMTALCPDKCGDSGEFAIFEIEEYTDYKKPSEYGDEKQTEFRIQLTDFNKDDLDNPVAEAADDLDIGDRVKLNWSHLYVDENGNKFPVRVVTRLTEID